MKRRYGVLFFTAFFLLGVLGAAQFRTVLKQKNTTSSNRYEAEQLQNMITQEKDEIAKLKQAITDNEKKRDANLKLAATISDNSKTLDMMHQLDDAKLKAGLTDVKGAGITVKLDDAVARNNIPSWMLASLVIHDADIKILLSDLKNAGCQAISINDERIMAMREQICAGPTILINKNKYPVPYVIRAIGNPDDLYKAMDESERMKAMRRDGIRVTIEKSKDVTIQKFKNNLARTIDGLEEVK